MSFAACGEAKDVEFLPTRTRKKENAFGPAGSLLPEKPWPLCHGQEVALSYPAAHGRNKSSHAQEVRLLTDAKTFKNSIGDILADHAAGGLAERFHGGLDVN